MSDEFSRRFWREILRSQLAHQFTKQNDNSADFSEWLTQVRLGGGVTHLSESWNTNTWRERVSTRVRESSRARRARGIQTENPCWGLPFSQTAPQTSCEAKPASVCQFSEMFRHTTFRAAQLFAVAIQKCQIRKFEAYSRDSDLRALLLASLLWVCVGVCACGWWVCQWVGQSSLWASVGCCRLLVDRLTNNGTQLTIHLGKCASVRTQMHTCTHLTNKLAKIHAS